MVGTIRMYWECTNPHNMTVSGEAVSPRRTGAIYHELIEIIIDDPGAVVNMSVDELCLAE